MREFKKGDRVQYAEPAGGNFYPTLPVGSIGTVTSAAVPEMLLVRFDNDPSPYYQTQDRIMYATELCHVLDLTSKRTWFERIVDAVFGVAA